MLRQLPGEILSGTPSVKLTRTLHPRASQLSEQSCVATIGVFDGIHRGHQEIIRQVKARAGQLGIRSVVISFEPTPQEYFRPQDPPARLSRFREKFILLRDLGVDEFVCLRFNEKLQQASPKDFINRLLVQGLSVKHLVVGDDFRFGINRSGSISDLQKAGESNGFAVTMVSAQSFKDDRISSSAVRAALAGGDLEAAKNLLGRYYMMSGRVVHGKQLGRALGFPTANIPVKRRKTATKGIFAVRVHGLEEGTLEGVANLGNRPTVGGGGGTLLEVFIFDFDRDIYGRYLDVDLIARLRDELKFPDLDSMVVQMNKDVAEARAILEALRMPEGRSSASN